MKSLLSMLFTIICLLAYAQDGSIVQKTALTIHDSTWNRLQNADAALAQRIRDSVAFYKITYMSDGLKVTAYMAEPKAAGVYPCIISNRGGNRDFGQWNPWSITRFLGHMASWNYVVIASQYRGNDGGEGIEEFGGADVNDVLNLLPLLDKHPKADTSRIGIEGTSRGGMMTYLTLKRSCRFKAAAVTAGMANAFLNTKARPEMDKNVFGELVPGYASNREEALKQRSAVFWAEQLCKTTPLLLLHGSSDWRVLPEESLELVQKLYQARHPLRFIFFEGADHGINEWRGERMLQMKRHFDYYVRDRNPWPSMEKHGN